MIRQSLTDFFADHIAKLEKMGEGGDEFAYKSLACMILLNAGWKYGDPDPRDPGSPDDGEHAMDTGMFARELMSRKIAA